MCAALGKSGYMLKLRVNSSRELHIYLSLNLFKWFSSGATKQQNETLTCRKCKMAFEKHYLIEKVDLTLNDQLNKSHAFNFTIICVCPLIGANFNNNVCMASGKISTIVYTYTFMLQVLRFSTRT